MQRLAFQATAGALRLAGKAAVGAVRMGQQSAERARLTRSTAAAAGGLIGPGDPAPPPGVDVLDYRGLADPRRLQLVNAGLPLGELIDVKCGPLGPVALPIDTMVRHACVIGPPGSGKTHSIIVPWIVALLSAGHSVVTVDVKGDLLPQITRHLAETNRSTGAQGLIWDYNSPRTHRWNFLAEISSEQGIDAAVLSLLGRQKKGDSQPFFYQRDYRWLRGLIRLVLDLHGAQASPAHLTELLADRAMMAHLVPHSRSRAELTDLIASNPGDYGKDISGLLNALSLFTEQSIRRAVATSDFTLSEAAREPSLLIAVAKLSDGLRGEQLSSLLISQFILMILDRFGSTIPRDLAFIIDEAPRLRERIDYEQLLAVARGARAGVCLAAQDVAQFGTEQEQSALLANCHTYVSMAGASPASAAYFGARLGTRERDGFTVTTGGTRQFTDAPQLTRQTQTAAVLGPREIMFPPFGAHSALVHCPSASAAPFLVTLDR
jgi:type IV secretory pathway TraG/TraD family ATPase VirD4